MKIIALKLNIKTLLLFFLLTTGLFAQQPTNGIKEKSIATASERDALPKKTGSKSLNRTAAAPLASITGNFSICSSGPPVGVTTQLTGSGTPAAINPWTSLNTAVASVDNFGLVTATGVFGSTTITYTDSLGNVISENVYVSTFPTITSLEPSGTFTTCEGGILHLAGSLFPNPITPWESMDTSIATVDNTGVVTGISGGTVNILYRNLGGCTVLQPVTIKPLLFPTVTCGATTFNQITFNWGAVAGAGTYGVSYTVNGGPFQVGPFGVIFSFTKTGLMPGDYVDVYVNPAGSVGTCFTIGTVRCYTTACTPATSPLAPTLVVTQPTCATATGTVNITTVAGETYSFDGNPYSGVSTYGALLPSTAHTVKAKNAVGCVSPVTNVNITALLVSPPPPISTGNIIQCETSPIQTLNANTAITPTPGQTVTWYNAATLGSIVATPALSATGSITYYAQSNDGVCSSLTRTPVTLTINAAPAAPISTGNITQCQQSPIQTLNANTAITPTPGQTVTWYNAATLGSIVATPTLNTTGTVTYYAQSDNGTCPSTTRTTVILTINAAPAVPISTGNITQCEIAPIQTLNANTAITAIPLITINWYNAATLGALVATPTLNTTGTITYYAQADNGTCPSLARTAVILTINAAPTAPITTGNITQCQTAPIQTLNANAAITPTPGQTVTWYNAATLGAVVATPTLNTTGTITYYAQSSDGTCPSLTRTAVVLTINAAPAAPISTGNITQCQALPIQTLDANTAITPTPGLTVTWYNAATLGALVATPTLNTTGTITYYAQSDNGTCPSLTRTAVVLTINAAPTAPISTGNITQCEMAPIQTLNANTAITPTPGQTISWYNASTLGALVATPTLNTTGTITYYAESSNGTCPSLTRTAVVLTINAAPTAPISTGNITQCETAPIQTLNANTAITPTPGQTVTWYNAATLGALVATPTLNTTGTITYYAQSSDGTCPSLTRTAVILTINPAAAAPISTGNITPCELSPIQTLNANTAITPVTGQTITWYNAPTLGALVATPTLNAIGTITYYAQSNDGTCTSLTRTAVVLTINVAPAAPISTGNITQCKATPVQTLDANNAITPTPGQTVTWYDAATLGALVAAPTLNTLGTITYYAQSSNGSCSSNTRTPVTLTINSSLNTPVSTGNITQCVQSPIQLLDANNAITPVAGETITWHTAATVGSVVATPTLNALGTVTYYAEADNGTCTSLNRTAVVLTINPTPTAPITTGNITQCEISPIQTLNANAAITPTPGQTITWYNAASGGSAVASPTLNTVGTITFHAESNDGTCASQTRTAVILTINAAPTAPISTGNITQCEVSPIQTLNANTAITPTPGQTVTWYNAATLGTVVATPTLSATGTITYYAESNDGTCPSYSRTAVTLTIDAAPTAPISTGNITQCELSPIQTLDANTAITPTTGQTVTWYNAATLGTVVATPTLNTIGTVTYYAESNDGCPSLTRTAVTLTIDPAPTAPISTGNITQCEIAPIQTLNANTAITPTPGQSVTWYTAATLGAVVATPTLSATGTITYYAESSDGTCPSYSRTAVTLTINAAPTIPISTGNITQCELSPIQTLDANTAITPTTGQTVTWYNAATLGTVVATPTLNTIGNVTYYAESNDGCPSLTRTVVTLKINPAPTAPIATGNITQCEVSPIQTLNANAAITPTPGQNITWYNAASGGSAFASPTLNTTGTVTYFAESNDGTCPSYSRTAVTLTINPAPTAPITTGNITQCEVSPIQTLNANTAITPTPGQTVTWYNAASGGTLVTTPTLNTTGTILFYAESNDGTCPSYTRTAVTLTINPAPAAPVVTSNTITQCELSPIQTLNANTVITPTPGQTVTWYNAPTGGSVIASPTLNTVATFVCYGESNDGTCPSFSRTVVTLTINPAPTAPISIGNITQCEVSPIQTLNANTAITPTPGQTVTWYTAASGGTLVATPNLNTTGTITYYAQSSDGTCPSYSRTAVTLTITAAPTAPIVTSNTITQCEISPIQTLNANTVITPTTGQTVTWYTAASGGTLVGSPTLNTTGNITYYAESNDGCPSLTRTAVTLRINPAPSAPASSGNITQCEISPIQTLNAVSAITPIPGQNVTWYTAATGGTLVPIPTLNTTGTVTYYGESNNGTCPSYSRTAVTLIITPAPTAPVLSATSITQCELSPIQTLNANTVITPIPGQTVTWFNAASGGSLVATPTLNTTGTVTYYARSNDGCASLTRTAVTLTINPAPATPAVTSFSVIQCELSPIQTLNANSVVTPVPGQTVTWYNAATLGTLIANPTLNATGTITYYGQSNDGTCPSYSRTAVTLTINPAPTAPVATSPPSITECELSPIQTLNANTVITPTVGQTVTWYTAASGGTLVGSPILNTTGTITYYAESNDGCPSLTRTAVTLKINAAPAAPVPTSNTIRQCQISPLQTLNANAVITPIPGQNITWFDAAGSPVTNPTLHSIGSITYYAQANDATCHSFTRTAITLTIDPAPATPAVGGDIFQCELTPTQTITATATVPVGQTIVWYDAPVGGNVVPNPSISTPISVIYYAQANDGTCNSLSRNPIILTISPLPVLPTIGSLTQPDCFTATGAVTIFPVQAGVLYSIDALPFTSTAFYNLLSPGPHTLVAKNTGGCLSPVAAFTINTQPVTPNAPTLVATQPTCTNATGSITIVPAPGLTYAFDTDPFTSQLTHSGLIANSTHTVKAKNGAGCISPAASLTLSVQPLTPAPPTLTPIEPTCTEATGSILIAGVIGQSYSLDGGLFTNSLIYDQLQDGSTHTVRAINGSNCISTPSTITLAVQPPTPATPTFVLVQPDCTHAVGELTILNVTGETYSFDGAAYSTNLLYPNLAAGTYTLTAQNSVSCVSAVTNIIVTPQPITATPAITDGVICVDQLTGTPFQTYTLDTRIDAAIHTFVWTLDGVNTSDTGSSIEASQPGVYTVVATNIASTCPSLTAIATVTESFPGLGIATQVIDQFSNDTSIIVTIGTGTGPFLYQLDHGMIQQSNVFTSVGPGTHTIHVTDENGCTNLNSEIIIMGYMNFFTPNGDAYNDVWNVIGLKGQQATIHIYDRYGKYIKQISPDDEGWDGTFNDSPMPSTDYWFTAEYTENGQRKEFKSHFSLVR